MSDWYNEGMVKPPGQRPSETVKKDGYRVAPGKDGAWAIAGFSDGRVLWSRWLRKTKAARAAEPGLPEWLQRRKIPSPFTKSAVLAAVVRCIGSITERPVDQHRCSGAAAEVLKLWKSLGRPPLEPFAAEVALVARAARDCPDGIFAQDIRNDGRDGPDRSHSVATLCVVRRWGDRVAAAQAWQEKTGSARTPTALDIDTDEDVAPPRQEW